MENQKKERIFSYSEIRKIADILSSKYDTCSHLLSFGMDIYWRKKIIQYLPNHKEIRLLDLATGTGTQLITIMKKAKQVKWALGIDISHEMVLLATKKIINKSYSHQITFINGDASNILLKDNSVECITMTFGMHNIMDIEKCLRECYRVLTPSGRLIILDSSIPNNRFVKTLYLFYLRYFLPVFGGMIIKNKKTFHFLHKCLDTFPYGEAFCTLLKQANFTNVRAIPLTFGTVAIYLGDKLL